MSLTTRKKRKRVQNEDVVSVPVDDHSVPVDFTSISRRIDQELSQRMQQDDDNTEQPCVINMSSVIESMPFGKMLSSIKSDDECTDIPIVSKAYETQYMRECYNSRERQCSMLEQCECMMIDKDNPFVGVVFDIPGVSTKQNSLCVLCLRRMTQMLFYRTIVSGCSTNKIIQKYGNICNQENEYHPSAMLICPPNGPVHCMPPPIVAHQRHKYSVEILHGVKYIKQHKVHMEDF